MMLFQACEKDQTGVLSALQNADILHESVKILSDVIVHDIYSPPVASRIYAYPAIAAYECLVKDPKNDTYLSFENQLSGLTNIPNPDTSKMISYELAALHAHMVIGKKLISTETEIEAFETKLYRQLDSLGLSTNIKKASISYGNEVANHILAWADLDHYKQTRTFPKFSLEQNEAVWKPTPPGYGEAIEPHWNKIRPFVIKSPDQFTPLPPTPFSTDKNSRFYKEVMEVYDVVKESQEENVAIAKFWDCNPYMLNIVGHAMFAVKKITPGGHWIGITKVACKKDRANMIKSSFAYAMTSIGLMDAFISCWDEKYRSKLTRPETVINENYDPEWTPILQTPPFPEHTSGHSVISRASAVILTSIFGENFEYTDDVEVEYGLPARKYNSFYEASEEAAVSRLYGGIHFRPAIDYGVDQGQKVGEYILAQLDMKS